MNVSDRPKDEISAQDLAELGAAKRLLENPGFTIKVTNLIGLPIEAGFKMLPDNWTAKVQTATQDALMLCLKGAIKTMGTDATASYPWWHKAAVITTGAAGGFAGLMALPVELPISTGIMMRSIADIGRSHGEQLATLEARLNCLVVFALGGTSKADDQINSTYFATRMALSRAVTEAMEFLASKTVVEESAPAILRLIAVIATRFQLQVSEKVAAQAIPVIGAIGGAALNYLFLDHFQDMSNGHFAVRKFERKYGADRVRLAYDSLPA